MHSLSAWTENNRLALFSWKGGGWYASSSIAWLIWLEDRVFRRKERYGNSVPTDAWKTWTICSIQKGRTFKSLFNFLRSSLGLRDQSLFGVRNLLSKTCNALYEGLLLWWFVSPEEWLAPKTKKGLHKVWPLTLVEPTRTMFSKPILEWAWWAQFWPCACQHQCGGGCSCSGLMQTAYVSLAVLPQLWWWIYTL